MGSASKQWKSRKKELSGKVGWSGNRDQRENEDQRQKPEVDVGVPGSAFFAANVFRVGTVGGVRLFAVGFAAIAFVIGSVYMLHRGWALAVDRVADSKHPIMVATRQRVDAIEDMARRPFRRPGSAPAR